MTEDRPALYNALANKALTMPRQYRGGTEIQMRRLWDEMTPAERAKVEEAWNPVMLADARGDEPDPRPGNPELVDDCIIADGPGNNWGAGV